jgi:lipopolysaccharide transport system permease protein
MFKRYNTHYFDLLWSMTQREFTVRYKKATFGFLWIILNPLLQMIIMGLVFSSFVQIPNYFVFLFSGLLPWQFVSLTITKVTPIFVNEKHLIQKSRFPREIIPLSVVVSNFLNFLIAESLFLTYVIINYNMSLQSLMLFTLAIVWIFILVVGVSLLASALNVRFRDVNFFTQTLVMLWFYATPIVYSINLVPDQLLALLRANPLSAPFNLLHSAILAHPLPHADLILPNIVVTLIVFFTGIYVFSIESPNFTDNL